MANILRMDLYRLVHGKMLWVGLAFLALVVVGAAGLVWFATTPEFAHMVNEQAQEEARQSGATVTLTTPNGADLDAAEAEEAADYEDDGCSMRRASAAAPTRTATRSWWDSSG